MPDHEDLQNNRITLQLCKHVRVIPGLALLSLPSLS